MKQDEISTELAKYRDLGCCNLAVSYFIADSSLASTQEKNSLDATHPQSPIRVLCKHSIEQYLKSYLYLKGNSKSEFSFNLGRDLKELEEKCTKKGLEFSEEDKEVISIFWKNTQSSNALLISGNGGEAVDIFDALKTCDNLHYQIKPQMNQK